MMIVFNDQYLVFEGMIELERQVKTIQNLETVGDFSYDFVIPNIAENRKILGIEQLNSTSKTIFTANTTKLLSDYGIELYIGMLRIEEVDEKGIRASFFSGNSNWFVLMNERISAIDMSAYKIDIINVDPSLALVDTWDNTEWITYPLIDKGLLENWSSTRLHTNNFIPWVYGKNIFKSIFNHHGLHVTGELLQDGQFNSLIFASTSQSSQQELMNSRSSFIGKNTVQSVGTSPVKITFTNESYPYYDGSNDNFSGSKYTADLNIWSDLEILLNLDAAVDFNLDVQVNGVSVGVYEGNSSRINYNFQKSLPLAVEPRFSLEAGDEVEVYLSIDSGTVNVTDGWFKLTVNRLLYVYPQFLLGELTQSDFIRGIFTMFNVVSDYDPYSRTVICNLFKNVKSEQQDISPLITSYTEDFVEALSGYSKTNIFEYGQAEQADIEGYNNQNEVSYGGGAIRPDNAFLSGSTTIEVPFLNSFNKYSNIHQANLMSLGITDVSVNDESIEILSAASGTAGIVRFTTDTDHGFKQFDYVWVTDTSTGEYVGIGRVAQVLSSTVFEIQNLPFTSTVTGHVNKVSVNNTISDNVYVAINIPNALVSTFSNLSTLDYGGVDYSNMAYAFFIKSVIGRDIDNYLPGLGFDNPNLNGFTGLTLLDQYYGINTDIVNAPKKIFAKALLPYNVYRNLNLTKSFRLKTKDFDSVFFCEKITGYQNSWTECTIELIRIS